MVEVKPIDVDGRTAIGVRVELPRTRLIAIATPAGYLMCGALDVELLDTHLGQRRIVAGRALGVRGFADLLERPLESVTQAARELGLAPGMKGRDALRILLDAAEAAQD
ncbi:MAG: DUF1805 domain-containing protein [Bacillota bacterium]|nr:MAG: DUF1805 domain-containing protein [Bacillota bacterium]